MSSIRDLNRKVILFVGRPSDTRKGLSLLLEGVDILTTLAEMPSFALWIVGGSPREVNLISLMIDHILALKMLREEGRILIWGRVENDALSELYSRASVTVVPSHREEFGIVAVEAMMSGCPVIAARTGGLQDIIREGETGILFEPDDALALAAALSGYLRNSQQRDRHRVAARQRALTLFSRSETLAQVTHIYESSCGASSPPIDWARQSLYQESTLSPDRLSRLRTAFNDQHLSVSSLSQGRHPVFHMESDGTRFVAKFFTKRYSLQASLFPNPLSLSVDRGGLISYSRVLYNKDNPIAPAIRHSEETPEPMIVTEFVPVLDEPLKEDLDGNVAAAIRRCQQHKEISDCADLERYVDALGSFATAKDTSQINKFDLASAHLNSRMTGDRLVLCRTHPQVELLRFRDLLRRRVWPVPEEFQIRTTQTIDMLLETAEIVVSKPLLAHGDPKPEHLLLNASRNLLMADLEHSRYAVGPLDLSLWLTFTGIRGQMNANPMSIIDRISKLLDTWQDRYLCMCWVVSEVIFFSLHRFSLGDRRELRVAQTFFRDLCLTMLNRDFIR